MSHNQSNQSVDGTVITVEVTDLIQALLNKRTCLFQQVQRFGTVITQRQYASISALKIQSDKVAQTYDAFGTVQLQLQNNNYQETEDIQASFDMMYFDVMGKAAEILEQSQSQSDQHGQGMNFHNSSQLQVRRPDNIVKLPPLNLPTFDGDFKQWAMFKDAFQANISNRTTLSNNQKFQYLRGQLRGEALQVIQDLETTDESYETAWKLLTDTYEDKQLMRHLHIKALFDIPTLVKPNYNQFRQFLDSFNAHLRSLEKLACHIDIWGNMLMAYLIESKLDYNTKKDWEKYKENRSKEEYTVEEFVEYLTKRCKALKKDEQDKESKTIVKLDNSKPRQDIVKKVTLTATESQCDVCQQQHRIYFCPVFLRLDCDARIEKVKQLHLCCNCFMKGHIAKNCTSSRCKKCNMKHNTLLHSDKIQQKAKGQSTTPQPQVQSTNSTGQVQAISLEQNSNTITTMISQVPKNKRTSQYVLLATAIIQISDNSGRQHCCRVLIDPGSQSSYVTQDIVNTLKLSTTPTHALIAGINMSTFNIKSKTEVKFNSRCSSYTNKVECLILPKITQNLPHIKIDIEHLQLPTDVSLADPEFNNPGQIDMLMGADIAWDLLTSSQIKLSNDKPILQGSHLGWLVTGPMFIASYSPLQSCPTTSINTCLSLLVINNTKATIENNIDNARLHDQLERFWSIEEPQEKQQHLSKDEITCEEHFSSTYQRHSDGKFIVRLPLKENYSPLGHSKQIALKRFHSVERRLQLNEELQTQYVTFMQTYQDLHHMTECNDNENVMSNYLPHHPVQKPTSETTKLRVVFDGSAKTESGASINEIQLVGPKIQSDLFDILLRFRQHTYVMTADIEKMYRMIWIHPDERHLQQILWRRKPEEPIRSYKLNTITYGLASSPFLAIRCINQLAQDHKNSHPTASKIIIDDFYVDDLLTGSDDITELSQNKSEVTSILQSGGFHLRKWKSNISAICESPTENEFSFNDSAITPTLGISWDPKYDTIKYSTQHMLENNNNTKRQIISQISKIFDPLGLLTPIITQAKLIIQDIWKLQIGWDDLVPSSILEQWIQLVSELSIINTIAISRHVMTAENQFFEIHAFADASQKAYGTAIYVRSWNGHEYTVKLLTTKSRVAPLKQLTLPRLELCAALLASRLTHRVQQSFTKPAVKIFYWSDSMITLFWIHKSPSELKTFIANRVAEIQQTSNPSDWHYVSTKENPADVLSRGKTPIQLVNSDLWWNGPAFLRSDASAWPKQELELAIDEGESEIRRVALVAYDSVATDFGKVSSFDKLKRIIGLCLRWTPNCKLPERNKPLMYNELCKAERVIIRLIQQESFPEEYSLLEKAKQVSLKSSLYKLKPYIDPEGILRITGRLSSAQNCTRDSRNPMILPKHHVTKLLVHSIHKKLQHCGIEQLLYYLRQRYWPVFGRNVIKNMIKSCINCTKFKPKPFDYVMGQLPAERINPTCRPFVHCGIDYAGPLQMKTHKGKGRIRIDKVYIALFVCLTTKAIHLELITDLTTEAFLACLTRFVNRRGLCSTLHSDNSTTFVGANNHLQQLKEFFEKNQPDLVKLSAEKGITWKFIPPRSPTFGGLWEANIKSMKSHLYKVTQGVNLTYEELYTLLTSIEACLNSRPLTPISSDPSDLLALTPSHFLIGDLLVLPFEHELTELPSNRISRWKLIQKMRQHFWQRWSREYLHQLHTRAKWHQDHPNVNIDDMVLLIDDNLPTFQWNIGRIIKLFPGHDGVVRVVDVKTRSGVLKRSIKRLCPLLNNDEPE